MSEAITIDPDDLVGMYEITERFIDMRVSDYDPEQFNTARSLMSTWIDRRKPKREKSSGAYRSGNGFPEPIVTLKSTSIYDWQEVRQWILDHYSPR